MATVRIPTPLRPHAGGKDTVEAAGVDRRRRPGSADDGASGAEGTAPRRRRNPPVRERLRQ